MRLFLLTFAILGLTGAGAQDRLRIAVVDVTEVCNAHPATKAAEAELAKKQSAARQTFNKKANELKTILQKHQEITRKLIEAGNAATASMKQQAADLLTRAETLEREVATLQTTGERDLEQEFLTARKRILDEIRSTIADYNSAGNHAIVLDRSASSANGIPQVLHAPGAEDITKEIISRIAKSQ